MISGVLMILLGESLFVGCIGIFAWFLVFLAGNVSYIERIEEPSLLRRFGDEYREYMRHVPRWIPRTRAWVAGEEPARQTGGARGIRRRERYAPAAPRIDFR